MTGMNPDQQAKLMEFVRLLGSATAERLMQLIPFLRGGGAASPQQPQQPGQPIHPTDPNFPLSGQPKPPQVFMVKRFNPDSGKEEMMPDSVPQLLAELNDNILDLMAQLDSGLKVKRRRRRSGQ